uniref:PDZ domain-containing protein n=1 Tax=Panagrolaimus superbus TaxID=310955 RepID=A0A914Z9B2_9BILA
MVQYPSNGGGYRDLPNDAPPPRLCLIQKRDSSQEYGFNLHAEKKGQFIGAVDAGSPADLAGLQQGDRIFAVNGASIVGVSHKTVVSWIKSDPLKCEMLVISEDDYQWYTENNIPIDMSLPNIIRVCKEFYDIASVSSPSVSEKSSTRHTVRIIKSYESPTAQRLYCTSIEVKSRSLDSSSLTSYSESTQSSMRSTPEQEFDKKVLFMLTFA